MSETTKTSIPRWIWDRLLGRSKKPATIPRDSIREGLETIVFVVVLVFLLKQFVVEAFVIPTGSMAETLYGYRKALTCPECGYEFQVNCSCEDPADGPPRPLMGYCCPNCRFQQAFAATSAVPYSPSWVDTVFGPGNTSGDRVLVLKPIYHREKAKPGDVVVFKFPKEPQKEFSAQNYIKRMWGVGGQTVAIYRGDLYVCDSLEYPPDLNPRPDNPLDSWRSEYTHHNSTAARDLFEKSRLAGFPDDGKGFKLIRKDTVLIDEMKRIVYDNDHQAAKLKTSRWRTDSGWTADSGNKTFSHANDALTWLRYQNPAGDPWQPAEPGTVPQKPGVVDNFLGYNGETARKPNGEFFFVLDDFRNSTEDWKYWVGDLILECRAQIPDASAQVVLELSKGPNQFQAIFQNGKVTLMRTGPHGKELAVAETKIKSGGTYDLRFANIDCRLNVWVDGKVVRFEAPVDYAPLLPESFDPDDRKQEGWVTKNDKEMPASIGATGGVSVSKLKIWRDTYFIREPFSSAQQVSSQADTYYVQHGHYLCFGDNSAQSSDSRVWGTVPERLLLGKAVFIFFPLDRIGLIK